jgi:hypothetical protein
MAKKTAAAKKREVNKTAAVKEYLAKHPTAGPSEVSDALKKQDIDVTPAYVSTIKSSLKSQGKAKPKSGRGAAKGTTASEDMKHAGELVFQALDLVMKAGYKEASALVEMAGKMVERVNEKK